MPEAFTGKETEIYFMLMEDYNALLPETEWISDEDANEVTTLAKSFEFSGGNIETEEEAYFGGSMLTYRNARQPFEVSFEVRIPTGADDKNFWETLTYGTDLDSAGTPPLVVIGFLAEDESSGTVKGVEFLNAVMTQFEPSFEADSYWQANVTFRVSPVTADGIANVDFDSEFATPEED
jgi:hypothetical protein